MDSRERAVKALNHEETDRVPIDFGATPVTGIAVSIVSKLREYYKLDNKTPVKVTEPFQMLGEIADDLKEKYGKHVIFWGGGVDTQKTLPLGTREKRNTSANRMVYCSCYYSMVFA